MVCLSPVGRGERDRNGSVDPQGVSGRLRAELLFLAKQLFSEGTDFDLWVPIPQSG